MILFHKSRNKQHYFTVVAINGKVLATSETFTRRNNCLKSVDSLIKTLTRPSVRVKIDDKTSHYIVRGKKRKK